MPSQPITDTQHQDKSKELRALGFIIVLLFPALTVTGISAYGFVIWMIQAFGGVVAH
ncbi:trimethylamine N-oxide reductase system protein TorE [Shewanella insulae]|uniref:trimethylamine N-oxide reductase system protein TorE n=1 Tax=Shewanella insulae TaxID=2681496 RepID=UPI001EFEE0DD|nr:trimethylamine N-oxide reductase system protein TorE [Shewanella insulae]MCG9712033.1 trimethylamine N-oxide reductase system protein TorE [Shewanella insulae]MCG9739908.1 trimethylamine N-oxide reductase system protein TorE [Shewanella insulae]MCG9754136.1 trimethylamine N-oxide reductase system protein TorE [Shewanella insulae]